MHTRPQGLSRFHALVCALLAVCLLLSGASALAESRQIPIGSGSSGTVLGGAAVEDTMYFFTDRLISCKAGDDQATPLGEASPLGQPATLIGADGELLRLDNATGMLARWDGQAFADHMQLNWDGLGDPKSPRFLLWPVWTGDALYGLLTPPSASSGTEGYSLVRFDAATGERAEMAARNLYQLAPYKPGKLLGLSLNLLQYSGQGGGTVVVVDAETGVVEAELGTLNGLLDGGIAYDPAIDTVYAVSGGQVMSSQGGGAFAPGAYWNVPTPLNATYAGIVDGKYAVLVGSDLYVADLSAQATDVPPLRIKGFGIDESLLQAFGRAYPDVPVARVESLMTDTASIINDFATADNQVDIYVLYTFQSLEALKEKGYLADLSEIPGVAEAVSRMYPSIQDAVTRDGKALAFPVSMSGLTGAWSVNAELLERFELEMPKTMLEYVQLLGRWEEEFAEDNPDYSVSNLLLPREQCVSMALQNYSATYETPGKPLTLNTPAFRAVLEAIDALPYPPNDLEAISRGEAPMPAMPNTQPMIETSVGDAFNRYGARDDQGRPLFRVIPPPPFEEGAPSGVMAYMAVCVINPNSANREQAERFVAFAAENMTAENRLLFCPDYNEPQRTYGYEVEIASLRAEIEELEAALPGVAEADRRAAEDHLAAKKQELEKREADDYIITAQAIADYRAVAENLNLMTRSSIANLDNPEANKELNDILYRYMAGESSLDEALRELDKRFAMMFQERMSE